jgi:hypothetical protein
MKTILLAAAMLALPLAANADIVTFDFSGVVTQAQSTVGNGYTLLPDDVGDVVTGTYTFNFANALASQSGGSTVGSLQTLPWQGEAEGGSAYNLPSPTGLVFTSTAQTVTSTGLISYSTSSPGSIQSDSIVHAQAANQWYASESQYSGSIYTGSVLNIISNSNGALVWVPAPSSLAGTPVPDTIDGVPVGMEDGGFQNAQGFFIEYNLTSLTLASDIPSPVPLPASAWLLVAGLGGLGAFARKRRAAVGSTVSV